MPVIRQRHGVPPPVPKEAFRQKPQAPKLKVIFRPQPQKITVLTPAELDRYKNLLLFAKTKVEGYFSGRHKSPYRGAASEFAEFKKYTPGDSVSDIDWRSYGKSRRLYLRQHEEETDMILYLLVDTSASMSYAGEGREPKLHCAAKIAAALAYLMHHQHDKTSLTLFSEKVYRTLPPGGTRRGLHRLISVLETVAGSTTTGMASALAHCDSLFRKRGQLVVLSDFHTDHKAMFNELSRFQHRGFGVLLLQVLDPDELNLPHRRVAKFVDMETGERLQVDPAEIRRTYVERMKGLQEWLAAESASRQFEFKALDTSDPYTVAIESYMGFRTQATRR